MKTLSPGLYNFLNNQLLTLTLSSNKYTFFKKLTINYQDKLEGHLYYSAGQISNEHKGGQTKLLFLHEMAFVPQCW